MKQCSFVQRCGLFLGLVMLVPSLAAAADHPFARGADVSWVTQMEAAGHRFRDASGAEHDLLAILKGYDLNAIRLRVWVDPRGGWSGTADVVAKAVRVKQAGMALMIDFHYSDSWADPGKQPKPSAWAMHGIDELCADVDRHTREVLGALKQAGVTPRWVQVGNETNDGLLWEDGRASKSMANFARLITSGHDAAKAVFPQVQVLVHISNAYDNALFRWVFDGLKAHGARYDMIAMSLYPTAHNWRELNRQTAANMQDMQARYGKPVIMTEVGMPWTDAEACRDFIADLIAKTRAIGSHGVFYWEPECFPSWNRYDKGAFDDDRKPTVALEGFKERPR